MQKIIDAVLATGHFVAIDLFGQPTNGTLLRAKFPEETGLRLHVTLNRKGIDFALAYDESDDYQVYGITAHYLLLDSTSGGDIAELFEQRLLDDLDWAEDEKQTLFHPDLNLSDEEIKYVQKDVEMLADAVITAAKTATYQLPRGVQELIVFHANHQVTLTSLVAGLSSEGIEVIDGQPADNIPTSKELAIEILGGNEIAYTVRGVNGKSNELIFVL